MTTRIRLRRMGSNKRPFFRVVVADQRSPRDGRFIENIGKYHPLDDPSVIEIDQDRALHWLRVGAQPSDQVRNLMRKIGIWDEFVKERPSAAPAPPKERPDKPKISKKAKAKAEAAAFATRGASGRRAPGDRGARDRGTRRSRSPRSRRPTRPKPVEAVEEVPAGDATVDDAVAEDTTPTDDTPAAETPEGS